MPTPLVPLTVAAKPEALAEYRSNKGTRTETYLGAPNSGSNLKFSDETSVELDEHADKVMTGTSAILAAAMQELKSLRKRSSQQGQVNKNIIK